MLFLLRMVLTWLFPMIRLPHTRGCFVCGLHNASGLRLDFETDGVVATTRFTPGPEFCGFRNTLHGGITATILDEVMVWACGVRTRRFAYCAELNVRYLRPGMTGEALTATGRLVENRKGRLFLAEGELQNQAGEIVATSSGKYIPLRSELQLQMLADFVEAFDDRYAPIGSEGPAPIQ